MSRITTADDAARAVLNLIRGMGGDRISTSGGKRQRKTSVKKRRRGGGSGRRGAGGAELRGSHDDEGGGSIGGGIAEDMGFVTPMTQQWSLIRGGLGGAMVELPLGAEGQVLAVVGGKLAWSYPSQLGIPANYITFVDGATEYDVTDASGVQLWV